MEWNYKMLINDVYWKGYAGKPTLQQKEIEKRSFMSSEYYRGGEIKIYIDKS